MQIELINTGTELLLGFVLNTNQQWLCRELTRRGHIVERHVTVSDAAASIQRAVAEALTRAQVVITTGGLGPTSDDLTRESIAELLGRPLREDPTVVQQIEQFFRSRHRSMPVRTRVQALVPDGAIVLPNTNGTAPGLAIPVAAGQFNRSEPGFLIMLPGPPRELYPMFLQAVVPLLEQSCPHAPPFACCTLRSTGIGESVVEETIAAPLQDLVRAGLEIGYCARFGEVDVRLMARGPTAKHLVTEAERIVRSLVGKYVFGRDDEELEAVVIRTLTEKKQTLTLAESCTGGYIANRLTNVPGASAVFLGGFVTYSNESKMSCLGVQKDTLDQHGAVSEATAREMAEGALARMNADFALAVTGIAGPSGGSETKPVGTVYLSLAGGGPTLVLRQVNRYDRQSFKFVTSEQALELLRRRLVE